MYVIRQTKRLYIAEDEKILVRLWIPSDPFLIKGVVQLVHGMIEHSSRYDHLAVYLCMKGYVVCASDLKGHGLSAANRDDLGYFGEKRGWEQLVITQIRLTKLLQRTYPHHKLFMLGHSMGSFITRTHIIKYGQELDGVILCGTSGNRSFCGIGAALLRLYIGIRGSRYRSSFINRMVFGSYNKKFRPCRTSSDWLSRDEDAVQKYLNDPYCSFVFTLNGFQQLLRGFHYLKRNTFKTPPQLPILLISGTDDPVGGQGKGIIALNKEFEQAGVEHLCLKLYDGARHELINEINRHEVYHDILTWLNQHAREGM